MVKTEREIETEHQIPVKISEFNARSIAVIAASFVTHFIIFGIFYSFGVYQQYYVNTLQLGSAPAVSFIGSVSLAFLTGLGILSGRITTFGGGIVLALGLLLSSFSTQLWHFILTQGYGAFILYTLSVLSGAGASFAYFPALSSPSKHFLINRGIAVGAAVSGAGIGGIVLSLALDALIKSIGLAWTLRITALLALVLISISSFFLAPPKVLNAVTPKFPSYVLKDPAFFLLSMMPLLSAFGYLVPIVFIPLVCHFVDESIQYAVNIGLTSNQGAIAIALFSAFSTLGRVAIGFTADRYFGRLNSFILCIFLSGLSMLLIWPFARDFAVLCVFSSINGFMAGGVISLPSSVIADIYGTEGLASTVGMLFTFFSPGNLLGAPLAGFILQSSPTNGAAINWIPTIMYAGSIQIASCAFGLFAKSIYDKRRVVQVGEEITEVDAIEVQNAVPEIFPEIK